MIEERPISTSELYQLLLSQFAGTITKTHMFVQRYNVLFIVDSMKRTVRQLNTDFATCTWDRNYVFLQSKIGTDIFTVRGEFVTKLPNKIQIFSDGSSYYSLAGTSVFSLDTDWNVGAPIYTRKHNAIRYLCRLDDGVVISDYDCFNSRYILFRNGMHQEIEQHRDKNAFLFFTLSPTKIMGATNNYYSVIDLTNKTEKVIEKDVDLWTGAVLCKDTLVYFFAMRVHVGSKRCGKKTFLEWHLIRRMCLDGFEDIELLLSLSDQQLLTFYLDQMS